MLARLIGASCVSATGAECERSIIGATRDWEPWVFREVERTEWEGRVEGWEGRAEEREGRAEEQVEGRVEGWEGTWIVRPVVTEEVGEGEGDSGGGVAKAEGVSMSIISPVKSLRASNSCGTSTGDVEGCGLGCNVVNATGPAGEFLPESSTSLAPSGIYVHVTLARDWGNSTLMSE